MKTIIKSEQITIAKEYAKEVGTAWIAKSIAAVSKIRNADKASLTKAAQSAALVGGTVFVASKLLPVNLLLTLMGSSIVLADLVDKVGDSDKRKLVEDAISALEASGSSVTVESIKEKINSI